MVDFWERMLLQRIALTAIIFLLPCVQDIYANEERLLWDHSFNLTWLSHNIMLPALLEQSHPGLCCSVPIKVSCEAF